MVVSNILLPFTNTLNQVVGRSLNKLMTVIYDQGSHPCSRLLTLLNLPADLAPSLQPWSEASLTGTLVVQGVADVVARSLQYKGLPQYYD